MILSILTVMLLQEATPAPPPPVPSPAAEEREAPRQEAPQQEAPPPDPARARDWWERLPPERRERMRERMRSFRELPPRDREEMARRLRFLEEERRRVWNRLSEQERARLQALPPEERRAVLDRVVRRRLEEHSHRLERRFPGAPPDLRDRPLPERFQDSERFLEEHRGKEAEARLQELVEQGWIGSATAEWLERASLPERVMVMENARKWRALAEAQKEGLFEQKGLGPRARRRFLEMPPRDCLRALDALRRGDGPSTREREDRSARPGGHRRPPRGGGQHPPPPRDLPR